LVAPPPAAPVAKTGTITYNSTYAKDVPNRNTAKSVIQYGRMVSGIVELFTLSTVTAVGDYPLFTISGVSLPSASTFGTCSQLNDFTGYDGEMPSITVNTNGIVTFNIRSARFLAGLSFAIIFNYLTA
jgi:hypothetical protein